MLCMCVHSSTLNMTNLNMSHKRKDMSRLYHDQIVNAFMSQCSSENSVNLIKHKNKARHTARNMQVASVLLQVCWLAVIMQISGCVRIACSGLMMTSLLQIVNCRLVNDFICKLAVDFQSFLPISSACNKAKLLDINIVQILHLLNQILSKFFIFSKLKLWFAFIYEHTKPELC